MCLKLSQKYRVKVRMSLKLTEYSLKLIENSGNLFGEGGLPVAATPPFFSNIITTQAPQTTASTTVAPNTFQQFLDSFYSYIKLAINLIWFYLFSEY